MWLTRCDFFKGGAATDASIYGLLPHCGLAEQVHDKFNSAALKLAAPETGAKSGDALRMGIPKLSAAF